MDTLATWFTPALLVTLCAWLRLDVREQRRELNGRIDALAKDMNTRFDDVNTRFDDVNTRFDDVNTRFDGISRELADQRERMAKLEGSLDGFLAGRRDRDAA